MQLASVQQAIREGRIQRGRDGKIDWRAADRDWARNTRPPGAAPDDQLEDEIAAIVARAGVDTLTFAQARTVKERYLAALRKLEYEIRAGQVVDREEYERISFAAARQIRDSVLAVADRTAEQLAAETDPRQVIAILDRELRLALRDAADALDAGSAAA